MASPLVLAQAEAIDIRAVNVSGLPDRPITLKVQVLGVNKETGRLILFHGVPDGVKLNVGGFFGNFWAVNSKVIEQLNLTAPPGFSGSFTVNVVPSGVSPAAMRPASFTVTVGEPQTTQTAAPPRLNPAAPPALPPAPSLLPAPVSRKPISNEAALMARAAGLFRKGDVSAARVTFEFLASQGSAAAAFAMAETYDPDVLRQLVIKGLEASPEKAEQWYEIAYNLGDDKARERINALARR